MFPNKGSETSLRATASYGEISVLGMIPGYSKYIQFELNYSPKSVQKYADCLKAIARYIGDIPVESITLEHVTDLKAKAIQNGSGESRIYSLIFALKGLLRYAHEIKSLNVLDFTKVKTPKRSRKEVIFLDSDEINQFINSIRIKTRENKNSLRGVRFRTLVEVLISTGNLKLRKPATYYRDYRFDNFRA